MTRKLAKTTALIALLAGLVLPYVASAATGTAYTGIHMTDPDNNGKYDPVPDEVSVTIDGHAITDYNFGGHLRCADGQGVNMTATFYPSHRPIPFHGNHFDVKASDPNSGVGLVAHITGTIVPGRRVSGHVVLTARETEGTTTTVPVCSTSYDWTATAQPPPPPTVTLNWYQALVPGTDGHQYSAYVVSITCTNDAVSARLEVNGTVTTVPCHVPTTGKRIVIATGLNTQLAYPVTVQPLVRVNGRLTPRGKPWVAYVRWL